MLHRPRASLLVVLQNTLAAGAREGAGGVGADVATPAVVLPALVQVGAGAAVGIAQVTLTAGTPGSSADDATLLLAAAIVPAAVWKQWGLSSGYLFCAFCIYSRTILVFTEIVIAIKIIINN